MIFGALKRSSLSLGNLMMDWREKEIVIRIPPKWNIQFKFCIWCTFSASSSSAFASCLPLLPLLLLLVLLFRYGLRIVLSHEILFCLDTRRCSYTLQCVVVWFKEKEENWPNWLLNKENWTEAVYLCGTLLLFLWANSFRSLVVLLMLHLRFLFSRIPGIIQAVCSFNYIKQCWVLCRESFVLASPESCFPIHF